MSVPQATPPAGAAARAPVRRADRIATLDAVRGMAVMGILLLNIVDFGLPGYAYIDPHFAGGASGANWWTWATVFVLADGKMRGLFTMLFGASTVLIATRATRRGENAARVHLARMAALLAIGMVHGYLIWSGDILVLYAVCGMLVFPAWRWSTRALVTAAAALMALQLALGVLDYTDARRFEAAAAAPGASANVRAQWASYRAALAPPPAQAAAEIAAYRGGWRTAQPERAAVTREMQTKVLPAMIPETIALMLAGMALFRSGFLSGGWPRRRYRAVAVAGFAICIPLYLPIVAWVTGTRFDPVVLLLTEPLHLALLRPALAVAEAAALILFVTSGTAPGLSARLAAAGQMAFSNYLGTSIVCILLFHGYGLGWFATLERWQLYPVVLAIWAVMLLWSSWWLDRFAFGPCEWLWRSMARGRWQPLRRVTGLAPSA